MFGIKTKIIQLFKQTFYSSLAPRLTSDWMVRDLMHHFHIDERGHRGSISQADLGYGWTHYGLVRSIKPKRVLCIGSRYGYIPALLAQACKDNRQGKVDFVDAGFGLDDVNNWTGEGFWKTREGQKTFRLFGLDTWVRLHVMTTQQFADTFKLKYDYIYLDGDHSYNGVKLDFDLFWPRLKKKGLMVFHDIDVTELQPEGEYGVHRLWKELTQKYDNIEFSYPISGLGIVQKK